MKREAEVMTLARAEGVYVGRDGGDGDVGGADGSGNGGEVAAEPLVMIEATAEAEAMAA